MTYEEILAQLQEMASSDYKENIIRLGIPEESCLGVATADLRKLARTLKKKSELAYALWDSKIHEAKLLAVLIMDPKQLHLHDIETMMASVISWDLCDHICKNLAYKMKDYEELIEDWCNEERTYFKRAAYTLIATAMIHDKTICEERIHQYLRMIYDNSKDDRLHVKKAILWALREIGKKDEIMQERALACSYHLQKSNHKAQIWIGKQAQKELENCVRVKGRTRLLSNTAQMAKE